ncbi:MAG: tetratricopeptide repeat protein [Rhodospirillaceae bacterium]|jgi:tetratricopeptide (TPR) repeat protein|nr:tetratricopeptide repeat protein [Rhodospirillaceae bacterium]MBT4937487.1 tetratricopeptide repeat protein [Rhodospirillaceae bacterium]MBT7956763.1 tetratricopeptide repeat protein [Rhodospirillaceae bacterium]
MKNASLSVIFSFVVFVSLPLQAGQEDKRLDLLFAGLAKSNTAQEAKSIENSIWQIWIENKNPPVSRIMNFGINSMNAGALKAALRAFNEVIEMDPKFAEGWNKRATIYYLLQDYPASVKDIAQTLRLEPRHFGALSGLGLINAALGRHRAALKAFEQASTIHPQMSGVQQHIKMIKEFLKGEKT